MSRRRSKTWVHGYDKKGYRMKYWFRGAPDIKRILSETNRDGAWVVWVSFSGVTMVVFGDKLSRKYPSKAITTIFNGGMTKKVYSKICEIVNRYGMFLEAKVLVED